jgi:hypothetical protein
MTPKLPKPKPKAAVSSKRRATLDALAAVDWVRQAQRVSVFLRQIRGDTDEDISADHARELVRARQVRRTVQAFARTVTGRENVSTDGDTTDERKDH